MSPNSPVRIERRIEVDALIERYRTEFGVEARDEFRDLNEVYICRCGDTGLRFAWPLTVAGGAGFYEQLQKHPWYYADDRWEYAEAVKAVGLGAKVMEVGSGTGNFLRFASKAGLQVRGIELNPAAAAAARNQGLDCEPIDLGRIASEAAGQFDAVCSFQVLEHVADPFEFLSNCTLLVRPGGLLLFSVPDSAGWVSHGDFLLDLPPHHMLGWSEESFRALEQICGLSLVKALYEPLPISQIENYLHAQRTILKRARLDRLLLNKFTVPLLKRFLGSRFCFQRGQSMMAVMQRSAA